MLNEIKSLELRLWSCNASMYDSSHWILLILFAKPRPVGDRLTGLGHYHDRLVGMQGDSPVWKRTMDIRCDWLPVLAHDDDGLVRVDGDGARWNVGPCRVDLITGD